MSCGVGCRCGLDLVLLWLWGRSATAAPIGPLAWEFLDAAGAALKSKHFLNGVCQLLKIIKENKSEHCRVFVSLLYTHQGRIKQLFPSSTPVERRIFVLMKARSYLFPLHIPLSQELWGQGRRDLAGLSPRGGIQVVALRQRCKWPSWEEGQLPQPGSR